MIFRAINCMMVTLLSATIVFSQPAPTPYGAVPSERQLRWQETELYCLVHLGLATYTDKEWAYGSENPSLFNPSAFNSLSIVRTAKTAGFKGIIIVAKHHDGFCIWPTKSTEYNITRSPWKNGKGDMLKEYSNACNHENMKMGIYCSPWDRNTPLYGQPEYVKNVYHQQLKELYSNYGELFLTWYDGANGGDGYYGGVNEKRNIDRSVYYGWESIWNITRHLQPDAAIFGDVGPDVRWVGNEKGQAGDTSWATYTPIAPEHGKIPANGYVKDELGIRGTRHGKYWMPAECDVPLRPGWVYHPAEDNQVKSSDSLMNLYFNSVGRGACLNLGLALDRTGRLHQNDITSITDFGKLLAATFNENLAKDARMQPTNVRGNNNKKFGAKFLVDNNRYSYWATDDTVTNAELLITLPRPATFNVIRLRENIKLGQRIEQIIIDAWINHRWEKMESAQSIGANRLILLDKNITAAKLRLRITSPVCIALSDVGLFLKPAASQ